MRVAPKPLLLISILFSSCVLAPIASPVSKPTQQATTAPQVDEYFNQLAEEFRVLRPVQGHFDGGEWQDEVDQWQGRKHRLMLELETQLDDRDFSRTQLVTLLGPPDHTVTGGDPLFEQIKSLPTYELFTEVDEFLVYEWRGVHDFLFFAIQDDHLTGSDWWYSNE